MYHPLIKSYSCCTARQSGFTLVELSIVLVIIGLIVGGVLTGQDLIKAAETRATVGQIEKYNTAVNTFRSKFNGIPGDLLNATNFGFVTRTAATGHGDGNGLLEACSSGAIVAGCETVVFWRDLSEANLIDGNFTSATDALGVAAAAITSDLVPTIFPAAKLGRGNYVAVFSDAGMNYYQITGITSTTAAGVYTLSNRLSPAEAFNMDSKIDDGKPLSGTVMAMEGTGPLNTTAAAGAATCVFTGGEAYNMTTSTLTTTPLCQIRFRFN